MDDDDNGNEEEEEEEEQLGNEKGDLLGEGTIEGILSKGPPKARDSTDGIRPPEEVGASGGRERRPRSGAHVPAGHTASQRRPGSRWPWPGGGTGAGCAGMRGAALALALAALQLAGWERLGAKVAGQPVAVNGCARECLKKLQNISKGFSRTVQRYEMATCRAERFVVFFTKKSKVFCGDPQAETVQDLMRRLDARSAPPSSKVDTPESEKPPAPHRFTGEPAPTKAPAGTLSRPPQTSSTGHPNPPAVSSVSAGSDPSNSPSKPVPSTEVAVPRPTLRPEMVPNEAVGPRTTEEAKTSGKGLTSTREALVGSPISLQTLKIGGLSLGRLLGSPAQSTIYPSSSSSSSRPIANYTEEGMQPFTTSARLLSSSGGQDSAPRTWPALPSTPCSGGTSKPGSVSLKGGSGLASNQVVTLQDAPESERSAEPGGSTFPDFAATSPIWGFRWQETTEASSEQGATNASGFALAGYRTHTVILVFLAGAVCVTLATVGWAWAKRHVLWGLESKAGVQGLLYSPMDEML
ncbi:uncharacterized protein LOC123025327 [Varanus komodoensis]|uniref:uncharacterized protein LOC123025327 n=1 Tax=Varanus komodoensis TaxID=61221 RepID=UPI001CF7B8FA|nr:uncharacterized protein LOC123025327 [Varanus komodoensis]